MKQLLTRGYEFCGKKITKLLASGDDWQIYATNAHSYILAVGEALYRKWLEEYSLPDSIFFKDVAVDCYLYAPSGEYLISSVASGPYPEESIQIEGFSFAFKRALEDFGSLDLGNAVYLEEYSMLLPTTFTGSSQSEPEASYGKWLTGGINVSVMSVERICQLVPWMPKEKIVNLAKTAGFDIPVPEEQSGNAKESVVFAVDSEKIKSIEEKGEFLLTGRPELERFFREDVIDIVLNQEKYSRMGINWPGAIILYGPPGCGKTYAVEKLAEYLGWPRFDINSSSVASPYIHDTSKKISETINAAINAAPSVLIIDEMEAYLSNRAGAHEHRIEEVAEFLRLIPEATSKGVLIFAMTNLIDSIDPAILRRGRFDHIIEVKMASAEEIKQLLKAKLKDLPIDRDIDIKVASERLAGRPLSDVTYVLREAGKLAVRRDRELIDDGCLSEALSLLPGIKKKKNSIGF